MIYKDVLYGEWELPEFLKKISQTKEMARLRGITQSSIPNTMNPCGAIPSRFHHGLGVAYLATKVSEKNPQISDYAVLLRASALLHDAGNPPFSHLSEYFLKEMTGMDGESFLAEILDGGEVEKILANNGLTVSQVVKFVTGDDKPLSTVLNGSMDIDNLDNVARYAHCSGLRGVKYNGAKIASSFIFADGQWLLKNESRGEVKKWQDTRGRVYGEIYNKRYFSAAMMLHRAVELAFFAGDLTEDFFFLDDMTAVYCLAITCNPDTKSLVHRLKLWDWYDEVFSLETSEPSDEIRRYTENWKTRAPAADFLAETLGMKKGQVCFYAGKGKDKRTVDVPFISGKPAPDNPAEDKPIHRIKVYIAPECARLAGEVRKLMSQKIQTPVS
ncbi:hypothetical protein A3C73_04335 [Candidatus Giovannonibacteria bacterium RIFCSPHIGHO2_02_FULL_44_11]|nr:MAG: hypothetical protein A3C73_04335 [Candidatus Giovannonibacteria bacterium RIFCSPHIGHO2_02_FULL_44_11]